ncbi:MAG TPA: hypothetical protein VMK16_18470 [Acidimicrobiales bacterium]|nr:hypothetical protein [Acidimicrobiales bacterium]
MDQPGMELSGTWAATIADEPTRRVFFEPSHDDREWEPVTLPGHWRTHPAFATTDGPLLHRRWFDSPEWAGAGARTWLVFDGIFYLGDVWLDGSYLGNTEGYFFPHELDITDHVTGRDEHLLAIEVACARQSDRTAKRNITGVFQHWECIDPDWNPGGVWRPVRVERTGEVRISRLRVLCREADATRAILSIVADLDSDEARTVSVRTAVAGLAESTVDHSLAVGVNRVEWQLRVDDPALWWPKALGAQPLHDVSVEVLVGDDVSHRRDVRMGFRSVSMRNWVLSVNGERIFVKGANHGPTRMALGEATSHEVERDVHLAVDAGLDLVRVHAHIARPELYDAADAAGLLVWQDMPLQWGYARSVRKQAIRQARKAVDLLGHHPSIALWCGHNMPVAVDVEPTADFDPKRFALKAAVGQQLPTFNRSVLDRAVKHTFERVDGTRPVNAHSGVLPHLPTLDGTDTHIYFGWFSGHERDFPKFCATVPRMARFVSSFGAQAVPSDAEFLDPEKWPDLDWETAGRTYGLQKAMFDKHVPPESFETFEAWRRATQAYQATVLKHHIETLRRLKYRPTGGFAMLLFADCHPSVTMSVLEHDRQPKQGYQALVEACRPVIVVAERPPALVAPGDSLAVDIHVVSDLRAPLHGAVVTARLVWAGGHHTWRWEGEVPADECVRIGTVSAMVPNAPGAMDLDLELVHDELAVTNRYRSTITRRDR